MQDVLFLLPKSGVWCLFTTSRHDENKCTMLPKVPRARSTAAKPSIIAWFRRILWFGDPQSSQEMIWCLFAPSLAPSFRKSEVCDTANMQPSEGWNAVLRHWNHFGWKKLRCLKKMTWDDLRYWSLYGSSCSELREFAHKTMQALIEHNFQMWADIT